MRALGCGFALLTAGGVLVFTLGTTGGSFVTSGSVGV